jgi:hypothetical protein
MEIDKGWSIKGNLDGCARKVEGSSAQRLQFTCLTSGKGRADTGIWTSQPPSVRVLPTA